MITSPNLDFSLFYGKVPKNNPIRKLVTDNPESQIVIILIHWQDKMTFLLSFGVLPRRARFEIPLRFGLFLSEATRFQHGFWSGEEIKSGTSFVDQQDLQLPPQKNNIFSSSRNWLLMLGSQKKNIHSQIKEDWGCLKTEGTQENIMLFPTISRIPTSSLRLFSSCEKTSLSTICWVGKEGFILIGSKIGWVKLSYIHQAIKKIPP